MKLSELITNLEVKEVFGDLNLDIKGIYYDSRKIKRDFLFICIRGFTFDGHHFIAEAINKGAIALVVEKEINLRPGITVIKVKDSRKALAILANQFYGFPSSKLKLIGVTGTNGKTTITYMLRIILQEAGYKTGLLGTAQNIIGDNIVSSHMTTMESVDLQKALQEMVEKKNSYAVMEVSSHALQLSRVEGCNFDLAIFSNISREHFEIHKNFSNYLEAKKKLFLSLNKSKKEAYKKFAIINIDEEYSKNFIDCNEVNLMTYGIKKESNVRAKNIEMDIKNSSFIVETPIGDTKIVLNFSGVYNIYNALAAIAASISQGIPLNIISQALGKFYGAPGRYKMIEYGQNYTIIIDFAHNYHGLGNILQNLHRYASRNIITVFGHGGEKYNKVRVTIGEVIGKYSDYVVITADNPKSEDPVKIAKEIEKGVKKTNKEYIIIIDRAEAIKHALGKAKEGDIVLIAGKGPENEQIYKNKILHYNDEEVVRKILMER
ncbi:MAG: UDP-N-acetylmuramoyl-L-alanyl-D-glutamate--2,6-diaminopimelate ligase [Candidatus Infernicultor aquiphilus]|uniref:UDP-N-acetylmuramyl-tripeptide synthetase n=1 Tax=Candidatus Infernicultor aquiphilus TaxID=1805029 RepID=A0A2M7PP03_9BACT|nr:MAG: UDP-N-acetylmuramoyl-L-alanyl-D-glutamate--2,6-diaminopimelate ligase [Candidatus Atribacteria bacterium CG08_land_8_20_14_0_20_33_29]PIW12074.1 MAG: UDP-N-acetylmuramoyl-L-alanyl-D-glutamate--2,6-diaminopimelate ligase [Candidatus Atribacteria bacterium CG17_big_fil_post_rev_8_21_14_2_50_34_11]PIX35221.1 MAG: UDP-N-acetylmuramoyl-L-alanyl-D-glutamate--2,6-diaminopimelate ligase [Candidatus Atribacteria bacterium CG_4_8_14_3_um_filter_34_18]PIY31906.1 MAG: UDP-N-acetylmuramoyl-L-alanyl-D